MRRLRNDPRQARAVTGKPDDDDGLATLAAVLVLLAAVLWWLWRAG